MLRVEELELCPTACFLDSVENAPVECKIFALCNVLARLSVTLLNTRRSVEMDACNSW